MLQLLHDRDSCCTQIANLESQHNDLQSSLLATENSLEILKTNNGFAFEKLNGKFKDKSKDAILIRKHGNELKKRSTNLKRISRRTKQQKEKKLTSAEHLANIDNIGEIHYYKENKTNGGKQIEFSAESNQFEKKSKVGINEMFSNC